VAEANSFGSGIEGEWPLSGGALEAFTTSGVELNFPGPLQHLCVHQRLGGTLGPKKRLYHQQSGLWFGLQKLTCLGGRKAKGEEGSTTRATGGRNRQKKGEHSRKENSRIFLILEKSQGGADGHQ